MPTQPRIGTLVPWFMFDLPNYQLITSRTIPGDISDSKQIILTETPIPGLNYQPVFPVGGGNRKISFTLPIIHRDNVLGNVLLLKQFDRLRNQSIGAFGIKRQKFSPMPKVLYYWGVGSLPLVYFVSKCEMRHKQGWANQVGTPQYTEIDVELILDEEHPLYKAEEMYRQASAILGEAQGIFDLALSGGRPY